jgi:cytochrome c oxidase subunit 2
MIMNLQRRLVLNRTLAMVGASVAGAIGLGGSAASAAQETVIKIVAQRFRYTPNEIVLKKGQAAVLEFTSLDFVHGFNIPELKIRADLPPGKVTTVRVRFDEAGSYDFLCDNFCGDGHEEMAGRFKVVA